MPSETRLKGSATLQFNLIFMIVPKDEISQALDPRNLKIEVEFRKLH